MHPATDKRSTSAQTAQPTLPDTRRLQRKYFTLTLYKRGEVIYTKSRHPIQYGVYHELDTAEALMRFNLNGEIVAARGKSADWPNTAEHLKRTAGNDWVYYSTGGYTGTFETFGAGELSQPVRFKIPSPYNEIYKATGEFYLPHFPYPTNTILGSDPLIEPAVQRLIDSWYEILKKTLHSSDPLPEPFASRAAEMLANDPVRLQEKAERLFALYGDRVTVLPPGARHVDYNVLPVAVADGCLYKCRFCEVKNRKRFTVKPAEEIDTQIRGLRELFGRELANYNALFLGEHDALHAGRSALVRAAERAVSGLGLKDSVMRGCSIFLFGSVDSFLQAEEKLFQELDALGCAVYINLGLESADQETLDGLGKPLTRETVEASFARLLEVNERYGNVEVTANFLMGEGLPEGHYPAFLRLAREGLDYPRSKGTLYLSPVMPVHAPQRLLYEFNQLARLSRLPTYLYTIQRL